MRGAKRTPSQVPSGESDQLPPAGHCPTGEELIIPTIGHEPQDEGPTSTPSPWPALLAESYVKSALAAFPLGRPMGERIILWSYPGNRDHAPRFLWSETLEKAKQRSYYCHSRMRNGRSCKGCLPNWYFHSGSKGLTRKFTLFSQPPVFHITDLQLTLVRYQLGYATMPRLSRNLPTFCCFHLAASFVPGGWELGSNSNQRWALQFGPLPGRSSR